jgi:hypothetical protein
MEIFWWLYFAVAGLRLHAMSRTTPSAIYYVDTFWPRFFVGGMLLAMWDWVVRLIDVLTKLQ